MRKIFLYSHLFLLVSCLGGQTQNSHSYDFNLTAKSNCADISNTRLCNAMEIIQSQCVDCHDNAHNDWASYDTDNKWIDSGRIQAGDPDGSPFILRLKNQGSDMPKNKPMLSDEDYQTLRDWISNI